MPLNLLSTWLTNRSNERMTEETNRANISLWREQAAYNAPEAQMQRLQAAGLNPNLAYGQIADSKLGTAPTMQAPRYEAPKMSVADYQQVVNMQANNQLVRAQAARAKAEADYAAYENRALQDAGMIKVDSSPLRFLTRKGLSAYQDVLDGVGRVGDYISGSKPWQMVQSAVEGASKLGTEVMQTTPHVRWARERRSR